MAVMAPKTIGIGRRQFPPELVLMILERFCWRDVLALEGDVLLQKTMLTKLNQGHPVITDCLHALDNYHELHRLARINLVAVDDAAELQFLREFLPHCPNVQLALGVEEHACLELLSESPEILRPLRKLTLGVVEDLPLGEAPEYMDPLERICEQCPDLELEHTGEVSWQDMLEYPATLARMTRLNVTVFERSELASLDAFCQRHPIKLSLRTGRCSQSFVGYTGTLQRLYKLRVFCLGAEDVRRLGAICRLYPGLSKVKILGTDSLQTLRDLADVHARLVMLKANIGSAEDVLAFEAIQSQSPRLDMAILKLHHGFLECFRNRPWAKKITISGNHVFVSNVADDRVPTYGLSIVCRAGDLDRLFEHREDLESTTSIHLTFSRDDDSSESIVLEFLKQTCERFPGLKRFEIEVGNEARLSSSVKKFLKKSVHSWSIIRRPRGEDA